MADDTTQLKRRLESIKRQFESATPAQVWALERELLFLTTQLADDAADDRRRMLAAIMRAKDQARR